MSTWKSKIFGDTRFNLVGWASVGLIICGASLLHVLRAARLGISSAEAHLLLAIYFVLLGIFGVALQNYCARVAKNIESADEKASEKKA